MSVASAARAAGLAAPAGTPSGWVMTACIQRSSRSSAAGGCTGSASGPGMEGLRRGSESLTEARRSKDLGVHHLEGRDVLVPLDHGRDAAGALHGRAIERPHLV